MRTEPLERLDSFPYRHRLGDLMTTPVIMVSRDLSVRAAASHMDGDHVSSVFIADERSGHAVGIVTERDIVRAVARQGDRALDMPVSAIMSAPIQSLPQESFIYLAMGRMDRLGIRHLGVSDGAGRIIGVLTARTLLRQRVGRALALGDQIALADEPSAMRAVLAALPSLALGLRREAVAPLDIVAVIGEVMRDLTARAAELAVQSMERPSQEARAWGKAPAPWCVLVLGSAGRGESLLAPDQDNAIIHAGGPEGDPWYAEVGRRLSDLLDAGGVPYCRGGVMASRPAWRHDVAGWHRVIDGWIAAPEGENLLNVDIFFDFHPVHGNRALAIDLRRHALDRVSHAASFLKNLSATLDLHRPPLGPFGTIRAVRDRVDLKLGALLPVISGARILALRHRIAHTSTADRLDDLVQGGHLADADRLSLQALHQFLVGLVLEQQIMDIDAGRPPSGLVDIRRLDRRTRRRLRSALGRIDQIAWMVRDALFAP